jgi:hypothetical protein
VGTEYGIAHLDNVVSSRFFRWPAREADRWPVLILAGIRGGDENCNRTVGLRLPLVGAAFLCLNIPLRQRPCRACLKEWNG